jgi:riboflavin-specific deaminase-like protein
MISLAALWFVFLAVVVPALASSADETPTRLLADSRSTEKSEDSTRSTIQKITDQIATWAAARDATDTDRPFVTLTFAQSLDGKIALYLDDQENETSSNLPMSGPESLLMTHALRSIHDAILVGGRTLSIDNPRLTNRLWGDGSDHQPRPVILDPNLRNIRKLSGSIRATGLIVCCSQRAAMSFAGIPPSVTLLPCRLQADGNIDLHHLLVELKKTFGIHSVMVEGGAKVLSSFARDDLVNCLCVTISPKFIGDKGLPAFSNAKAQTRGSEASYTDLAASSFFPLGNDCVLLSQWSDVRSL